MDATRPGADDTAPLILPVGLLLGPDDAGRHTVRRGVDLHGLDPAAYRVWGVAHGSAAAVSAERRWDRHAVLELARAVGPDDPGPELDGLIAAGLVVEVAGGVAGEEAFARDHRVVPLLPGLGNTDDEPSAFGIGIGGEPLVTLGFTEYDVWQFSPMDDTLWDTCRSAADAARDAAATPAEDLARLYLSRFLRALPALLLTGAAHLDVAFRLDRPAVSGGRRDAA